LRTVGFVLAGLGVTGIAAGSVTGILALHDKNVVDGNCNPARNGCNPTGFAAAQDGKTMATVSTIGFAAAALSLAAGAWLVITNPSVPASPRATLGATLDRDAVGFRVAGSF
jgi:hypothetical protein